MRKLLENERDDQTYVVLHFLFEKWNNQDRAFHSTQIIEEGCSEKLFVIGNDFRKDFLTELHEVYQYLEKNEKGNFRISPEGRIKYEYFQRQKKREENGDRLLEQNIRTTAAAEQAHKDTSDNIPKQRCIMLISAFSSIAAVIVAFSSLCVNFKIAKEHSKQQLEENLPQLEIRRTQDYNETIKLYDNDKWLFFNRGGKLSNFSISHHSFFKFTYRQKDSPNYDTLVLPLYDYFYMGGILTGESEGLIYQLDNNHGGVKEKELRDSLLNFGYYEILSYAEISYIDIFDKPHLEYFQLSPSIMSTSQMKWNGITELFMSPKNENNRFTFSQLRASQVIAMMKNHSR